MDNTVEVYATAAQKDENTSYSANRLSKLEVFKTISKLAIPMGLSFTFSFEVVLAVSFLNALSTSSNDIAASTLVSIVMNTVCVLGGSPLFCIAMLLSNKLGEWKGVSPQDLDREHKKRVISSFNANALLLASIATPLAFSALFFAQYWLVSVFQQSGEVAASAQQFLSVYAFAIPGVFSRAAFEQIMFSFGKTRPAMWIGLMNLTFGTLIAAALGFGIGPIPKMGPQGVALGFLMEAYSTAICFGLYVAMHSEFREFEFFTDMLAKIKTSFEERRSILQVGGSIAFTVAIDLAMILSMGVFSGLIGTKEQSAMAYNMQFLYFEFLMLAAFSFSCAQEMSRKLGAKEYLRAHNIAHYGLLTTLVYLTPLPIFFSIYPEALLMFSRPSNGVTDVLKHLVPIMSLGVVLDCIRYNILVQLRAIGDLMIPNCIAVVGMFIGIMLSGILGLKTSLNIDGVAAGYAIGVGLTAAGLAVRWKDQVKDSNIGRVTYKNEFKELCCSFFNTRRNSSLDTPLLGSVQNSNMGISTGSNNQ